MTASEFPPVISLKELVFTCQCKQEREWKASFPLFKELLWAFFRLLPTTICQELGLSHKQFMELFSCTLANITHAIGMLSSTAHLPVEFNKVFYVYLHGDLTFSGSDESAVCNDAFNLHKGISWVCPACLYAKMPNIRSSCGQTELHLPTRDKYHTV